MVFRKNLSSQKPSINEAFHQNELLLLRGLAFYLIVLCKTGEHLKNQTWFLR